MEIQQVFSVTEKLKVGINELFAAKGIYTKPLNRNSMSTVHGAKEIESTLEMYEDTLKKL